MISYTNTKPFVYGLLHWPSLKQKIEVSFDSPAECARKLTQNEVDLGIVPVAALLDIPNYQIISDYCIGSDGAVNSVFLFSLVPIKDVKLILLDIQSRTSNNLTRILCKWFWKITPRFIVQNPLPISSSQNINLSKSIETKKFFTSTEENKDMEPCQAYVLIGDRTFSRQNQYPYQYDLGQEWKKLTGLPFVYAVWAANKNLNKEFQYEFNQAMAFGLDHREDVIKEITASDKSGSQFDYNDYLFHKLNFNLDSEKKLAMRKFLAYTEELSD